MNSRVLISSPIHETDKCLLHCRHMGFKMSFFFSETVSVFPYSGGGC
uniref:Uncharacterized protein n=1 Tax=Lepeophtheirus salmonis TaxID=72036 RepID=A0A0K2V1Z0_LEPSM